MKKYLITGKNGLVASNICQTDFFKNNQAFSHLQLNITHFEDIEKAIIKHKPNYIINAAAYTNVTLSQSNPKIANEVNNLAVKNLCILCKKYGIKLIHFGTDFIFRDNGKNMHKEDDMPNPINIYGNSKYLGEQQIFKYLNDYLIVRISWVWGKNGKNFISSLPKYLTTKDELKIVSNQYGKTTYVSHLVNALICLINKNKNGIFHFANNDVCSRYTFATKIQQLLKLSDCKITPILQTDFLDKTPRPDYSVMDTNKIQSILDFEIPTYTQAIMQHYNLK